MKAIKQMLIMEKMTDGFDDNGMDYLLPDWSEKLIQWIIAITLILTLVEIGQGAGM